MGIFSTKLAELMLTAKALYEAGNYQDALTAYEQLASKPGWARLMKANLALCRLRLGLPPFKLSVIVPVFNTGKYLEQCLISIQNQTEPSLEIIAINDGSTDNSLQILQQAQQQDKRLVLINNEKPSGNPGTPRNQGIAIAKGEYLGFVDSDDWVETDYFASLLAAIEPNGSDMAFAAGYTNHLPGESKIVTYNGQHFCSADKDVQGYHPSFMIWDKVYRTGQIRSHAIKLGETKAAVDVPFIFKAYYWLKNASFASTTGYHYRRESDSSVTVNFRKNSNCDFELQAYKDVETWCREANVSGPYRNLVQFRKVSSYIYTLNVIALSEFHAFFAKIQPELRAADVATIVTLAKKLNRAQLAEKFKALTTGDSNTYRKAYRQNVSQGVPAIKTKTIIEGLNKGVLFFPDWSHTNPYQKLFYASLAQNFGLKIEGYRPENLCNDLLDKKKNDFGYLHVQWLHSLMCVSRDDGADRFISVLEHAKQLGYKILYTAHNIFSHDGAYHDRELKFRRKIATYFDYALVHGELARQRLMDEIGVASSKIHVMPHGTYQGYYPSHSTRGAARQKLGLEEDKFVFLFFGNIRGYKGVDALLEAYNNVRSKRNDVALIIAGRVFDAEIKSSIEGAARADASILFHPFFIEESDVQYYFSAADIVVLPYEHILTSGAAMLSVAFERPVIAPRAGVLPEMLVHGKHGYLFDSYDAMLAQMERAVNEQRKDANAWAKGFSFTDLNARLRWPLLTAHPAFCQIFSAQAQTVDYVAKRSHYRYALIRILGNDLPLRHSQEQTYRNLKFTLEHEKNFNDCLKLWVLNRIVDKGKKQQIMSLLTQHGKQYIDIPYKAEDFAKKAYCFEELSQDSYKLTPEFAKLDERTQMIVDNVILKYKNNYIINNNGARNRALQEGMKLADWVFPWDGNCFITEQAWSSIATTLQQRSDLQYHIVPMERLLDNQDVLRPNHVPQPCEEPQIIFRKDAELRFNENLMYGFKPKVEMLKRLGVPGKWDKSNRLYPWSKITTVKLGAPAHNYSWAGWVARLFSEREEQELESLQRAANRELGTISFIQSQDKVWFYSKYNRNDLVFYDMKLLQNLRAKKCSAQGPYAKTLAQLASRALEYLNNPLYSVMDKTTFPPSNNKHDYWHPAPYCWPNPASPSGLPYIYKDGERVPGTQMYEPLSNKYDRTAIQRLFDETTTLALAGHIFSNAAYTEKATKLIRHWFLDTDTAMNPHLTYSQVIMGKDNDRGTSSGLIETKDMYYFLDAVRLVANSPFWSKDDEAKMLDWCKQYLLWFNTSEQGQREVASVNNHGTAFDLQTYALAAYIGDIDAMYTILLRALSRMKEHVDSHGIQPHEMKRTTTAHYTAFNLHLWLNLSILLRKTSGFNLFLDERDYNGKKCSPLKLASNWVLSYASGDWPFKQIDNFDKERYQHIYHTAVRYAPFLKEKYHGVVKSFADSKVVFFPHDGIAPYWTLQG